MGKRREPHWELWVIGSQREDIEPDLVAQIVLMLGRQLAEEASDTGTGEEDAS